MCTSYIYHTVVVKGDAQMVAQDNKKEPNYC